jgi:hypothetical protein
MKTQYFITYCVSFLFFTYNLFAREKYKKYYPVQYGNFTQNHKKILGAKLNYFKIKFARVGANHTFHV